MTTPKPPAIFKPRADPHCGHCGFSLTGLPDHGLCPECGTDYDPRRSYWLLQAPSASASFWHFAEILLVGIAIVIAGITAYPILVLLAVPATLVLLGWRLRRYCRTMRERVLAPGMTVVPMTRSLEFAGGWLAWALLVAGALAMAFAALLLLVLAFRSGA